MATFKAHLERGTRFAYVYHIAGMDWAATNDPEFCTFINSAGGGNLRRSLFGSIDSGFSADLVSTYCTLDSNLGVQTITGSREGGIDVGSWSVKTAGDGAGYAFGSKFDYTPFDGWQSGLTGLDWMPDTTVSGIQWGIMARDLIVSRAAATLGQCRLYWQAFNGNGLKAWLESNSAAGVYLWIGSGCVRITSETVEATGDQFYVDGVAGQFNTPLEDLIFQNETRYQITNTPLEISGMSARLFAQPVAHVEGVYTIIDEGSLPFLLRTGKVQQNATYSGGMWSVSHSGFTSQFKYKGSASSFSAQIAGYTFCRYTPVAGSLFNARGNAQLPHVWALEYLTGESGKRQTFPNGDTQTGGWVGLNNTTVTNGAINDNRWLIGLDTTSTKPKMWLQNAFRAGVRYNIRGRVFASYNNDVDIIVSTGYGVLWQKRATTFTGGLFDINVNFTAPANTYIDIMIDNNAPVGGGYIAISDFAITVEGFSPIEAWLCDPGDGVHFETLDELKAAAIVALNAASDLTYALGDDGDIVCNSNDHSVFVSGPVPYVCGWGWRHFWQTETAPLPWLENPGQVSFFSTRRALQWPPGSTPQYYFETPIDANGNSATTPHRMRAVAVRRASESQPEFWFYEDGPVPIELVKNRSTHAYYWQAQPDNELQTSSFRELYSTDGGTGLYYFSSGGIPLQTGDIINMGAAEGRVISVGGTPQANGSFFFALEGRKFTNDDEYFSGVVYQMPVSLAWMTGWFDYYMDNPSELPEGTKLTSKDPFEIVKASKNTKALPGQLFREMLGDTKADGTRGDVPISLMCSTIPDLFGFVSSDRKLVNWSALDELVTGFGLVGAEYTIEVPKTDGEGAAESVDTNLIAMLHAVCQTHNVIMVWRYDDSQRSWILDFRASKAFTIAESVLQSKVVDNRTALIEPPTEVQGGGFSFAGIDAKYTQTNGVERALSVKDPSGRVQHINGGKTLSVDDKITRLSFSDPGSITRLSSNFANRILYLSYLSRRVKMGLSLDTAGMLDVGDGCAVDLAHLRNPQTGRQQSGLASASVDSMQIMIGADSRANVELTISRLSILGISPSMNIDTYAKTGDKIAVTDLAVSPLLNEYAATCGGLSDLATFGCFAHSDELGVYKRDCSCGAYQCFIVERNVEELVYLTNMWPAQIDVSAANVAAGECEIEILDGEADFPADETYGRLFVLIFAARDNADLQPCQIQLYGWLGNDADVAIDSDSGTHTPATVGQ